MATDYSKLKVCPNCDNTPQNFCPNCGRIKSAQMDYDYIVRYVLDGRKRSEIIIAKCSEEARELFRRQHPQLNILSVEVID